MTVRVRFAPSPTGYLHVGGARTAIFDWLFARKANGKFILRIEDTDTERSTGESEESIIKDLKWCGMDWDEGPDVGGAYGPYRQSERVAEGIYDGYARQLIDGGKAYYAVYAADDPKKIVGKTQSHEEAESLKRDGSSVTVNFKMPEGKTVFEDIAKGRMEFDNSTFDDMVIIKSNGYPTYNFAVVVDDHLMEMTHVVRGEDHLTNTPKQITMYRALGWNPPEFMHIPLIMGPDRTPLSKRHGGTSVDYFRAYGIIDVAFVNYLALLGWGVNDEIFNPFEKVESFDLDSLSNKPATFDYAKLEWINGQHMRAMSIDLLIAKFKKWADENLKSASGWFDGTEYANEVVNICRLKVNSLKALADFMKPFFEEPVPDEKALEVLKSEKAAVYLENASRSIEKAGEWTVEGTEKAIRGTEEFEGFSRKEFFRILRAALLGQTVTPGLFESVYVLGREKALERLEAAKKTSAGDR